MATKISHPQTANQKEYNRQIERIERFGRKYGVRVSLPSAPKRVTQQELDRVTNLKGKEILKISSVYIADKTAIENLDLQVPENNTINALDLYEALQGDTPLSQGGRTFISHTRFQDNILHSNDTSYEEKILNSFEQNVSQYRPFFRDTMLEWRDKMIDRLGGKAFVDTLTKFEQEFGGITKAEAYNLARLTKWLNKFAARIDEPTVKEVALQEVEEIQSDQTFANAFEDYRKYRRKKYYKR